MELGYKCKECQKTWDGGLHDDLCPNCKSKNVKTVWTDESNDPPDDYVYPEDDEDSYEEESNDE